MGDSREMLSEIARLGRWAASRRNAFTPSAPCDWQPHAIENPGSGMPFTDASAWELICGLLDQSPESFEEVVLDRPPGQIAFATVHMLSSGIRVYIKVQLSGGKAHGRSFHISTKG